ncbi:hypothetical protein ALC56_05808 [Trachymyrmex septentrionalis]|uniref:Uncharacterized protein n=1 Tax=Trachymyrmex septentrionalis TaxID=34720 RepID=A0A151JXP8_9HYME|nr:hypothetical protein ALC56_05808 [Trachymyrmex septentrionalis]
MKIYAAWYAACTVLCVCAHPPRGRSNEMYVSSSRSFNPKSTADSYGFEKQLSATELFEILDEDSEEFEERRPSTMRAIVTKANISPVLLPLIIEPEAEMLPVGYKGVKPPGVTHMELAFAKPQTSPSRISAASMTDDGNSGKSNRFNQDNDAHYAASKYETQVARDDHGTDSLAVFGVGSKGDAKKQNEKVEHSEVSGESKSHSENEDRAKNHKEEVAKKKGAIYETRDGHERARNTAGYRNVYHKDEFKKDADFYSNGHRGGHFKNHGRYGEKHAAAEGKYAKGRNNDSRFVEVEANEQRNEKKTRQPRSLRSP